MQDEAASSTLISGIVPLLFRLGTMAFGLLAVGGGILYVKQDKLLVSAPRCCLSLMPRYVACSSSLRLWRIRGDLSSHVTPLNLRQYFPEIGGIPRRPADNPRGYRSPEERQVPFETHMIPCSDGVRIHAWLMRAGVDNWQQAPTIIFFHGNAGNIGLRLPNALQMIQYLASNVLLVEYRGYGNSDSVPPSERGLKLDAEAALQFARRHDGIDSSKLFLFGRSLGGSVAFHLAAYSASQGVPLAGVMVENTFTSISSMVDQLMPFLIPIKPLVLRIGWDSAAVIPKLGGTPLLFLAGAKDELVPHSHMRDLYRAAVQAGGNTNLVSMHVIPDGTHNESWMQGGPAYWDAMRAFMGAALQQKPAGGGAMTTTTGASASSSADVKSSIPSMSSRFVDIAKEAVGVSGRGFKKEL